MKLSRPETSQLPPRNNPAYLQLSDKKVFLSLQPTSFWYLSDLPAGRQEQGLIYAFTLCNLYGQKSKIRYLGRQTKTLLFLRPSSRASQQTAADQICFFCLALYRQVRIFHIEYILLELTKTGWPLRALLTSPLPRGGH